MQYYAEKTDFYIIFMRKNSILFSKNRFLYCFSVLSRKTTRFFPKKWIFIIFYMKNAILGRKKSFFHCFYLKNAMLHRKKLDLFPKNYVFYNKVSVLHWFYVKKAILRRTNSICSQKNRFLYCFSMLSRKTARFFPKKWIFILF